MKQSRILKGNVIKSLFSAAFLTLAFSSCETMGKVDPQSLPMETSDREIVQMAQKAFNNNNFKLSEQYYNVLLQRYGNNTVDYIIGKYEIAHIAVKKKDYSTAVPILEEILGIYSETPAGELPASYKVLAQNDLKKVPEKTRMELSSSYTGKQGNDYYENDDYGDTDFFNEYAPPQPDGGGNYSDNDSYWD
ncbi:MAG: hypothetical protein IJU95_08670 [Treponema sp.]|nr:hypothetical protein [Treponema sp.]